MNGVSWLQLTLQRARLLLGENIFTVSSLLVLVSALIYCIIQFTYSLLCLAALLIMLFQLWVAAELKGQVCLRGSLYSVNLPVLVPD